MRHDYSAVENALNKKLDAQYVFGINLTAAFGKGNEPTAEQMDGIMAKFTNSWFDGTKNLFRANATLNKLMAVDARTEFEAKNMIANGDFSNGFTGWSKVFADVSTSNNEVSMTPTAQYGFITPAYPIGNGSDKYYLSANVKSTSSDVRVKFSSPNTEVYYSGAGAYQRLSAIAIPAVGCTVQLIDVRASGWDPIYAKGFVVLNLTAIFGAGKEPTKAEMDRLMARFPNSWFDGVKPIQTIETLYQEKANKTQEAWITPTLLNGETNSAGFTVAYYKDEFGVVRFKGRIVVTTPSVVQLNIPVGYRPGSETKLFPISVTTNAAVVNRADVSSSIVIYATGTYDLSSITYRAEA